MKIILISEYAPNEVHGIAVHLRNLVWEFDKKGHEFIVFTSKPAEQLKKEGWTEKEDPCIEKYRYMGPCITNVWNKNNRICVFP